MITIKTSKKDLFYKWLLWLDPILDLKELDRKVLAAFISLHYAYRTYQDQTILNSLLFSEETKKDLAVRLEISESQLNKALRNLEEKGLIQDNKIASQLTTYPPDSQFRINVYFQIEP